jgi:hypothetical protein
MFLLLIATLAFGSGDSISEFAAASPADRFQMFARTIMGDKGCPDALAPVSSSHIVAAVTPRLEVGANGERRLLVNVAFTNSGDHPEGLDKRYLMRIPQRLRTDYLWLFDPRSKKWLEYIGPHGRIGARGPDDYAILSAGQTVEVKDLDVTSNYEFKELSDGLVAKVLFLSAWTKGAKNPRVESKCARVATTSAPTK